jgi:hypothetical protein
MIPAVMFSFVFARHHTVTSTVTHVVADKGKITQAKVGTRGSLLTANILDGLVEETQSPAQVIATKFVQVFQNPIEHMSYLGSREFAVDFITVCEAMEYLLEDEPRCLQMQSPVYVFGELCYFLRI